MTDTTKTRTIEERAALINEAMQILDELRQDESVPFDPLNRLVSLITELSYHPEYTHEPINTRSDNSRLKLIRRLLHEPISMIRAVLHDGDLIGAGQEWTIGLGVSCGYTGRIIIQVDSLGSCAPDSDDEQPNGDMAPFPPLDWERRK